MAQRRFLARHNRNASWLLRFVPKQVRQRNKRKWRSKTNQIKIKVKTMPTFFEKKQLVTPGELLAEGDYVAGENSYMEGNKIYAQRIGLADAENKKENVV